MMGISQISSKLMQIPWNLINWLREPQNSTNLKGKHCSKHMEFGNETVPNKSGLEVRQVNKALYWMTTDRIMLRVITQYCVHLRFPTTCLLKSVNQPIQRWHHYICKIVQSVSQSVSQSVRQWWRIHSCSVCLPVCLSVCLAACLPACDMFQSASQPASKPVSQSVSHCDIHPSIHPPIHPSICRKHCFSSDHGNHRICQLLFWFQSQKSQNPPSTFQFPSQKSQNWSISNFQFQARKSQNMDARVWRNAEFDDVSCSKCRTCKNIGTTENADLAFLKFCNAEIQRDNMELAKKE